jgi:hypothetical protein
MPLGICDLVRRGFAFAGDNRSIFRAGDFRAVFRGIRGSLLAVGPLVELGLVVSTESADTRLGANHGDGFGIDAVHARGSLFVSAKIRTRFADPLEKVFEIGVVHGNPDFMITSNGRLTRPCGASPLTIV